MMGLQLKLKLNDISVKKCKKKFQVEFTEYWRKFYNNSNKMKNKAKILLQHGWKSLINIENDFKTLLNFNISHDLLEQL